MESEKYTTSEKRPPLSAQMSYKHLYRFLITIGSLGGLFMTMLFFFGCSL